MNTELHYSKLHEVAQLLKLKSLSPVELTQLMLDRIERLDGSLQSYATVTAEIALEQAAKAEKRIMAGGYKGPLHGVPIAVKDLCFTRGIATKGGLEVLKDFVPAYDGTVVNKLREAGSVLLGKLNLTEGALSAYNPKFPIPQNPWNKDFWAGVSSSGSGVATAAGLCFGSIGTDTGGSIRYPSMANGTVGLKPTYGLVSRYGVLELAASLDHVGPMTRSSIDAALMLETLAGYDPHDATSLKQPFSSEGILDSQSVKGIKIGIDESYISSGTDPELVDAINLVIEVLRSLGAELVAITMPKDKPMDLRNAWLPITAYEAYRAHRSNYPAKADQYGGYLADVLKMGMAMSESDYKTATNRRNEIAQGFEAELTKVDAVICPSGGSGFVAEKSLQYGNMETMAPIIRHFQGQFTIPADLAGTPALTVPCGLTDKNTPLAVQFLGSKLSEATLCRIGIAYESATDWHLQHPPI